MGWIVSSRALVLQEMIRGIDCEIEKAEANNEDTSALRAERERLAQEAMFYLNRAVKVKRVSK